MAFELVALTPVAGYAIGDRITDPADIAKIVGTDAEANVVRVAAPDAPAKKSGD